MDIESIKRAFKNSLGVVVKESNYDYYEEKGAISFEKVRDLKDANTKESEWIVFESEEDAEDAAKDKIKDDLENEGISLFNKSFIEGYAKINNLETIADEEAQFIIEDMDDEETIKSAGYVEEYDELITQYNEAENENLINKIREKINYLIDRARDNLIETYKQEITEKLENSPMEWLKDRGYDLDSAYKNGLIIIDEDEIAEEAIQIDGVSHLLDIYDGQEEEIIDPKTKKSYYAYGTN